MKKKNSCSSVMHISDEGEDCSDSSFRPEKTRNFILTHELRIFVGTWNVAGQSPARSLAVDLDEWLNLKSAADIYVLGFQEVVPLNTRTVIGVLEDQSEARKWNMLISKILNKKEGSVWLTPTSSPIASDEYEYTQNNMGTSLIRDRAKTHHGVISGNSNYKLVASKKMVGVFVTIWMKKEMLRKYCVSNVKVSSVACGIMGCLGNKGSVSVSMSVEGTGFCFVTAHLASGEKKGDEGRRNQQVQEIFKRTNFSRVGKDEFLPLQLDILGHDRVFWFGDLNYRLNLEDGLARELIRKKDFKELQKFDQLKKEQQGDGVFQGWREGSIEFAPTYKYYLSNSNRYTRNLPTRSGDKHRTPAWCDRIMWYGKGIQQLSYICGDSKFSDHKPVSALFTTEIEILNKLVVSVNHSSKNVRILNPGRISVDSVAFKQGRKETAEEARRTLRALIKKEVQESHM